MVRRRVTLEDVAARANVGRGTVSRVINGAPQVSARTRAVVVRAIRELGYVPDGSARSLAGGRAGMIALVLSEVPGRRFEQPYLGRIMRGISSAANDAEVGLTLIFTQSGSPRTAVAEEVSARPVDGALLISLLDRDPLADLLERNGVPVVLGGRPYGAASAHRSYVDADNETGGLRATEYLIRQGRHRIATIAGTPHSSVGADRLNGYREALYGRAELVEFGDFSQHSGALAMRRLLDRDMTLDAVFAASDNMALGALYELQRQGRRIPGDVAVIGFEDADFARHTLPSLTTLHQPTEAMGRHMVDLLLARIDGTAEAGERVICDTSLVLGRSA